MLTVLSIIGTRPEAIKMAPVIAELAKHPHSCRSLVCVTGQHRELLDQVLKVFSITPDYDLNIMQPGQNLSQLTAKLLIGLDEVVVRSKPDWILAQGDTTSVFAAGLTAYYHRLLFGHIEAGLRTGQKYRPFPEEINRRLTDVLSDLYFAPTEQARDTLLREGVASEQVFVTGNTVIDALLHTVSIPYQLPDQLQRLVDNGQTMVLITAHRRESFGEDFAGICLAIRDLAAQFRDVQFVYPVHLNPNVRRPVHEILSGVPNVLLIEPVDYITMVHLMKKAKLLLTDSGGIQEEAPALGVPLLIMRDTTERPEVIAAGVARLTGTRRGDIVRHGTELLIDHNARMQMSKTVYPYGQGDASQKIVSLLFAYSQKDRVKGSTSE